MRRLELELEQLEDQLDEKTKEIRQLKRRLSRYEELLELTGVRDQEAQECGALKLLSTVMQLPYLRATTASGRAGELQRLTERMQKPHREMPGQDVPPHLRPANFCRSVANRQEAQALWDEAQERAAEALQATLLSSEEWRAWSGPDAGLTLEQLLERLEHLELLPLYAEELNDQVMQRLDGAWVPDGFLGRVERAIEQKLRAFKASCRPVPLNWDADLWSVLGAGFQTVETDWEKKGISREAWESLGLMERLALPDKGIHADFWHSCGSALTELLIDRRHQEMRCMIAEEGAGSSGVLFRLAFSDGAAVVERVFT